MSSAYLLVSTPTWMKRLLSRSVHSNKVFLKIATTRLRAYCEAKGILDRGAQAARVGKESARISFRVFHRPAEGLELCRSHTSLIGAHSLPSTAANIEEILQFYDGMRAFVQNDNGVC